MPLTTSIRILRQQGIIDDKTSALLDDLRTIGNRAAHPQDGASFTVAEALRIGKLTDDVIAVIRALE
jgi:hypothetical protein